MALDLASGSLKARVDSLATWRRSVASDEGKVVAAGDGAELRAVEFAVLSQDWGADDRTATGATLAGERRSTEAATVRAINKLLIVHGMGAGRTYEEVIGLLLADAEAAGTEIQAAVAAALAPAEGGE